MATLPQPVAEDSQAAQLGQGLIDQMKRQMPDMQDILWLIRNGASLQVHDRDGNTPLILAMGWGNKVLIGDMIAHGADVNGTGARGVTPMQIGASTGDAEIVKMLLDAGGDVMKKNEAGRNALELGRKNPNSGVRELIEAKAAPLLAEQAAEEGRKRAVRKGMPTERPVRILRTFRLKPQ